MASRTLDLDGLVRLADDVEVDEDGSVDVAAEPIVEIPATWDAPREHGAVVLVRAGFSRRVPADIWLADLAGSLEAVPADAFDPFEEPLRVTRVG